MIYINSIILNSEHVHYWACSEDLSPHYPRFKEIQNYLKKLGFEEVDNHNYEFVYGGKKVRLGFRVKEVEYLDIAYYYKTHPSTVNGFSSHELCNFSRSLGELLTYYNDVPYDRFDEFFSSPSYNMEIFDKLSNHNKWKKL